MLNKYAPYILAFALFVFGLSLGFFAARVLFKNQAPEIGQIGKKEKAEMDKLYSSQTATIHGQILKREDSNLTVKNFNTGKEGKIRGSDRLVIIRTNPNSKTASSSSDLASIELNKEVSITLEMINGNYQATLIQYLQSSPGLPPVVKR